MDGLESGASKDTEKIKYKNTRKHQNNEVAISTLSPVKFVHRV